MNKNTKKLAMTGILTAIVIVLQVLAVALRPTGIFTISLVLIPIVIGAALYDEIVGAWLGFVFGVVVLINDAALFYAFSIPGTVITVLLKGTLAGLCAGLVFKLFEKKNQYIATIAAAIVCPVVNTGLFMVGCRVFFWNDLIKFAAENGFESATKLVIFGFVGVNFLIELGINIVLSPVIIRLINIGKKEIKEK